MDIETVPRKGLDDMVEAEVAKRTERRLEQSGGDPAEAESLIRSTSPFFGEVVCVGMRWLKGDGTHRDNVICESNEHDTLERFFDVVNHESAQSVRFVHYNGLGFDIPFLSFAQPITEPRLQIKNSLIFAGLVIKAILILCNFLLIGISGVESVLILHAVLSASLRQRKER